MKLKHEWILIKPIKEKEITDSGIYLGKAKNQIILRGEILKIGEKVEMVSEGDTVLYHHSLGLPYFDKEDTELKFIKEDSVMAVEE